MDRNTGCLANAVKLLLNIIFTFVFLITTDFNNQTLEPESRKFFLLSVVFFIFGLILLDAIIRRIFRFLWFNRALSLAVNTIICYAVNLNIPIGRGETWDEIMIISQWFGVSAVLALWSAVLALWTILGNYFAWKMARNMESSIEPLPDSYCFLKDNGKMIELRNCIRFKDYQTSLRMVRKSKEIRKCFRRGPIRRFLVKHTWNRYLNMATRIVAAYQGRKLLGYILFRYDEDETILLDVLTIPATIIIRLLFPSYRSLSNADAEMVSEYRKTHESAGAILLIAASSDAEGMEIRKAMLEELEKAEKDREICILTNGENSRFLEENGFRKVAERNIKARKRSFIRMLYSRGIEPLESASTLQGPQHYQWV